MNPINLALRGIQVWRMLWLVAGESRLTWDTVPMDSPHHGAGRQHDC